MALRKIQNSAAANVSIPASMGGWESEWGGVKRVIN